MQFPRGLGVTSASLGSSVLLLLGLLATAAGCGQLGAVKQASVPYDPHVAKPDPAEIAANPCKYGDVARCIQRCQADESSACNSLGVLFEYGGGSGTASEQALAPAFYGRACESNYAPGCTNLAWLYTLGKGVPKDQAQSMALFTRAYEASRIACRRGDMSGCMMAGELLLEGRGVDEDEALALSMFRQACDGGERRGCAQLEAR
jgi:TPR repeat protein